MLPKKHYPRLGFELYEGHVINRYADLLMEYVSVHMGLEKPKPPVVVDIHPPAPIIPATRSYPTTLPAPPPTLPSLPSGTISHVVMTLLLCASVLFALARFARLYPQRGRKAIFECAASVLCFLYQLRYLFDPSILPIIDSNTFLNIVEDIRGTRDWTTSINHASVARVAWLLTAAVCFSRFCNGLHWLFDRFFHLRLALIDLCWAIFCISALENALPGSTSVFHGTRHDLAMLAGETVWAVKQLAQERGLLVKDLPYAAPIIALCSMVAYLISISDETSNLSTSRENSHLRDVVQLQFELIECMKERQGLLDKNRQSLEDQQKLVKLNTELCLTISRLRHPTNNPDAPVDANASDLASEVDVPDLDKEDDNSLAAGTEEIKKKRTRKRGGAGRPRNEFGLVGVGKNGKADGGAEGGPSTASA